MIRIQIYRSLHKSSTPNLQSTARPYARIVCLFIPFFRSDAASLSRNFLCSSALMPLSLRSRSSFLALSVAVLRSSAFSPSSNFLIFLISSSRVDLIFLIASGRKCATFTRRSGSRRKYSKSDLVVEEVDEEGRRRESETRFRGTRSSSLCSHN